MTDYNQCRERPISSAAQRDAIKVLRRAKPFVFVPKQDEQAGQRQLFDPAVIFQVTFNKQLDPRIVARIKQKFADKKRELAQPELEVNDVPGYIYCFHDIGDRPDVLKVGRTDRTPEKRLREWEYELSPGIGQSLIVLFAYSTECNKFAEDIMQDVLSCRQIHNRINPNTGGELKEFFTVENALALSILIRETLRFINEFWRTALRHRRRL